MSTGPPSVVELFGQPGSGKSAVARAAAAEPEQRTRARLGAAWKQQSVLAKALLIGRAIFGGSCLAKAITLAKRARLSRVDSLFRLFRLVIKSHWLRSQTGLLLLEEGHLQELWSIFYSAGRTEPDPHLLSPLIACLYRGFDVRIVFLDVAADEVVDRIRGRLHGKSRLDRLAEPELRQHIATTAQLPHRIVEAAKLAGLNVHPVDAALPIETTAELLRAMVRRFD